MVDETKEITEKIKNGSYYKDAYQWYESRYLTPISERTYSLFIAIGMLFLLIISVENIQSLITEDEKTPIVIRVPNSTDYFSLIKPLAESVDTTQDAVSEYLIKDYVHTREKYLYREMTQKKDSQLKYNLKKIKASSSKRVLNEYKGYMSEINPYSPIARYKDHTNRTIEIKSFEFSEGTSTSGKARIVFEAFTQKKSEKKKTEGMFEVAVHFRLPDIETIARTGAPLRFLVKYYKAKPLGS